MKDFNEFIEHRKPLQKVMENLNESDGIMLELMFYEFAKQQIAKAKNLPITIVHENDMSEQFYCSSWEYGKLKCETQCLGCANVSI